MSRSKLAVLLGLGAALALSSVASATTMRALTVDDLSADADSVVVGTVISVADVATLHEGNVVPRTVTRVSVQEHVAGRRTSHVVRIVQPEGRLGALRIVRDASLEMHRGQRVLLFLRAHQGAYRTIGVMQGAFVVRTDARTRATTVARAGDPGLLLGTTKARGIDLDARPTLDAMRRAVIASRAEGTP